MVMVVPVNPYVNEAENVTQKNRKELAQGFQVITMGTFNSKTMIVMMMANTPSLNAASRSFGISLVLAEGHAISGGVRIQPDEISRHSLSPLPALSPKWQDGNLLLFQTHIKSEPEMGRHYMPRFLLRR